MMDAKTEPIFYDQLNRRVDGLDEDLHNLEGKVDGLSRVVSGMGATVSSIEAGQMRAGEKLDALLRSLSTQDAREGTMRVRDVQWGIKSYLSLVAIGIAAVSMASGIILWAMRKDAYVDQLKQEHIREVMELKLGNREYAFRMSSKQ